MHKYKKHEKEDGTFDLKEYRIDGVVRVVGDDNSGYISFVEAGNTPVEVDYVAPPTPTELAIARRYFSKQEVRQAFRDLNLATELTAMISQETEYKEDWDDLPNVDSEHPSLLLALEGAGLDINTVKLQIGGLND